MTTPLKNLNFCPSNGQIRAGSKLLKLTANFVAFDWSQQYDCGISFCHHPNPCVTGIPYDKHTILVTAIVAAINIAFAYPKVIGIDLHFLEDSCKCFEILLKSFRKIIHITSQC